MDNGSDVLTKSFFLEGMGIITRRFDDVDKKLAGIEAEIEKLALITHQEFMVVHKRIDGVIERMDGLTERMEVMEERMATKTDLQETEKRLMYAIEGVEVDLSDHRIQSDRVRADMWEKIDEHDGRLRVLERGK